MERMQERIVIFGRPTVTRKHPSRWDARHAALDGMRVASSRENVVRSPGLKDDVRRRGAGDFVISGVRSSS